MIDAWLPSHWPEEIVRILLRFRQGDILPFVGGSYAADFDHPLWEPTRILAADTGGGLGLVDVPTGVFPYVMITTQTCDICEENVPRPRMPFIQVAPVYNISSYLKSGQAGQIRRGTGLKYLIHLTGAQFAATDEVWVADLRCIWSIEKSRLVGTEPIDGFADEPGYLKVAEIIATRVSRPAIDARVSKIVLEPLDEVLQAHEFADGVCEVRVKCSPQRLTAERAEVFVILDDNVSANLLNSLVNAIDRWQFAGLTGLPEGFTLLPIRVGRFRDFKYSDVRAAELAP